MDLQAQVDQLRTQQTGMAQELTDYKLMLERRKTKNEQNFAKTSAELQRNEIDREKMAARLTIQTREEDLISEKVAEVTRAYNVVNEKRRDLAKTRRGILGAKEEHL